MVGRWCTPRGGSHLSGYLRLRGFATHRLAYMLDSLVRVSRRVGWKAQSASVSSAQVHKARHEWRALRSSAGATASAGQQKPALVPPRQPTLTSAPRRAADQLSPFRIRPERTRGLHSLPSQQFQALFNSLFKVLFIFPSRYLFAIGLLPVFSLGWNLPPT